MKAKPQFKVDKNVDLLYKKNHSTLSYKTFN